MMEAVLPRSWKEQFALAAAMRQEDILHREKMARLAAHQRQITAEQENAAKRKEAEAQAFTDHALAPPTKVAAYRVELDRYDTKTVEALMENQETMDAVRRRLDEMLEKAHVLPDGRRVFKTEDGTHVFDEHGEAVAEDVIRPDAIPDGRTKFEAYKAERDEERRLAQERSGLIDYQAKLDASRDRLDGGDITEAELNTMQRDLRESMPDAVRRKAGLDEQGPAPAAPSASALAMPVEMDNLMRQTGLGQPSAPGLR